MTRYLLRYFVNLTRQDVCTIIDWRLYTKFAIPDGQCRLRLE